tara:strand:+ start:890 stop:1099 length:210 start_codon:yes stop_codon:yes gene_type:complete
MKKFFVLHPTKNITIEIEFFKFVASMDWIPIFNHTLDLRFKGSHKSFYWALFVLGIKIFEIDIFRNTQT